MSKQNIFAAVCFKLLVKMCLKFLLIGVVVFGHFLLVQPLECGINFNSNKVVRDVINGCMIPEVPDVKPENATVVANNANGSFEDELEEPQKYGPRRGLLLLDVTLTQKREIDVKSKVTVVDDSKMSPNETNGINATVNNAVGITSNVTTPSTSNNATTSNQTYCVVQCLLNHYQMLGIRGFPEIDKVTTAILKNTPSNRELRDIIQDAIDECFRHMSENGLDLDSCTYSARLVTCLVDKAKFNCADWPVGELPFPHVF